MAPIDRSFMTSYQSAIVTMIALSGTDVELFDVVNIVILKSGIEVTQGH